MVGSPPTLLLEIGGAVILAMRAGVVVAAAVVLASWFAGDVLVSLTSIPPEKVGPLFGNRRAPEVSYDDLVGLELHAKSWWSAPNSLLAPATS